MMINREQIIRKIEQFSKQKMGFIPAHDYEHADRTRNRAIKIAKGEGYSYLLNVEIAALLHDIGFSTDKQAKGHGERGSNIAHKFLSELALNEKHINQICYAIQHHNLNHNGEGKLLEILRDADRMELFGTIGISRGLQSITNHALFDYNYPKGETWEYSSKDFDQRFAEGKGKGITVVDQLNFQISCFDDMHTETGKRFASPLVQVVKDFIKGIEKEYQNSLINMQS